MGPAYVGHDDVHPETVFQWHRDEEQREVGEAFNERDEEELAVELAHGFMSSDMATFSQFKFWPLALVGPSAQLGCNGNDGARVDCFET